VPAPTSVRKHDGDCPHRTISSVFRQGEIYRICDGPHSDHRVLVVSRDGLNHGHTVVTVQFTSKRLAERKTAPNCVFFPKGSQPGLTEDCVMQSESIAVTDKVHLVEGPLGTVGGEKFEEVLAAIGNALGAHFYRESAD
jgi:mRNA-degrading endonuclease toxin of MazEF toxin-antitoxin module